MTTHDHSPTTHKADDPVHASIAGPGQVVAAVPSLLGFHPSDSLVVVGLREAGAGYRLVVTARLDLVDARTVRLTDTLRAMRRGGATHALVITYLPNPNESQDGTVRQVATSALETYCDRADLLLVDALVVADGRWSSQVCTDADCCPPLGRLMPDEVTEVQAAATYLGITVADSRSDLERRLAPAPGRERLTELIHAADQARLAAAGDGRLSTWERAAVRRLYAAARAAAALDEASLPTDEQAAHLAVVLATVTVRDRVWLAVDARRVPATPLWADLIRRLPAPWDAAPAFLLAWQSWRAGDGAIANIATARALESDPDYSAAVLLSVALQRGVNPGAMPKLTRPSLERRQGHA